MSNTPSSSSVEHSAASLVKITLCALVAAGAILLTAVLPAEFGLDPTGLGKLMGLDRLSGAGFSAAATFPESTDTDQRPASPLWKGFERPRTNTLKISLMPGQGAEIKSVMNPGDNFVFDWRVEGGTVSFDMHGEKPNAHGAFTSYWIGENQSEASGSFTAPFAGSHGWYWENKGVEPVTVVLQTHGFYGDLYMP